MAEDLLQHLGRIARLDHQRRGSVPQIMNPEPVAETGTTAGRDEGRASPVRQPHHAAARHGEHELIGVLARDRSRDLGGQEPGQRDGAGLVRFRAAQDDTAADIGKGAADIDSAAIEVDVADAQGGRLAPAQPGVSQKQSKQTPAPRVLAGLEPIS